MFSPDAPSTMKKIAGTASMVRGRIAKCWYFRLTQLHSTPHATHGRQRMSDLSVARDEEREGT